jgi:hypothetical protein
LIRRLEQRVSFDVFGSIEEGFVHGYFSIYEAFFVRAAMSGYGVRV